MPDLETLKLLANLGSAVLLAVVFGFLAYKFGGVFLSIQQQMADAMGRQAQSMAGLNNALNCIVTKDNAEHREILLSLQVVGRELRSLRDVINKGERDEQSERGPA